MVLYLDLVFLLNVISDGLALYVTARLSGLPLYGKRLWIASVIGGIYGVFCLIPPWEAAGSIVPQAAVAALLVWLAFGARSVFLRLFLLFFVLSCALGGVMIAITQHITTYGLSSALHTINWKIFFLAGGLCYFLLSVVFRGNAHHAVARQLFRGTVTRTGKTVVLDVLLDTGHTLSDPVTGKQVMTVWSDAMKKLFAPSEWDIVSQLNARGAVWCMEQLGGISPGVFHLIPYRAVGITEGMLLSFCADSVTLGKKELGTITIALSPTPMADGGSYTALWGCGKEEEA